MPQRAGEKCLSRNVWGALGFLTVGLLRTSLKYPFLIIFLYFIGSFLTYKIGYALCT